MKYILDLIVILLIALISFIGYKKGLIKVAFKIVSFFLAILISIILYKPVSNLIINHTPLCSKIESSVSNRLSSSNITKEETDNLLSNYYNVGKNATISLIAKDVSVSIVNIAVILIIFILSRIVLGLFKLSGDLIAKLPLIKQVNHLGGFLYGLIKSFIIIYGIFAIISLLVPLIQLDNFIKLINSSIICNIMYNNNLIFMLFL